MPAYGVSEIRGDIGVFEYTSRAARINVASCEGVTGDLIYLKSCLGMLETSTPPNVGGISKYLGIRAYNSS